MVLGEILSLDALYCLCNVFLLNYEKLPHGVTTDLLHTVTCAPCKVTIRVPTVCRKQDDVASGGQRSLRETKEQNMNLNTIRTGGRKD